MLLKNALRNALRSHVGVKSVQFKLDGANLGAPVTTAPYTMTWDTSTAMAGSHSLTAVASDAAANATTSAAVTVTIGGGGSAPTVTITTPHNGDWVGGSTHIVAVANSSVGLATLKFWGNGGIFATVTCSGTSCTGDVWWNTGPLPNAVPVVLQGA